MFKETLSVFDIAIVTFIISLIIMPVAKKLAIHVGAIDVAHEARRIHKEPTPRFGGIGMFFAFLMGYVLFGTVDTQMISILIGGFILVTVAMLDDIAMCDNKIEMPQKYKFFAQIIAALIVMLYGGILLSKIDAFGFYIEFGFWQYPITLFFILGSINCINLIDGIDGLSGGISLIYFLTIGAIAMINGPTQTLEITLAFIMAGSILGFLFHNFHPAKIFAGDAGSMFMGYIIAVVALLGFKNVTVTSLIIPLLLLAIPIMDTLFAILRRLLKGQSPTHADKEHLHHQILKLGFNSRKTVLIIYAIDILFAIASFVYISESNQKFGILIYGSLTLVVLFLIIKTSIIFPKDKEKKKLKKERRKKLIKKKQK